ncbi:MAG TPA: PTS system mannose/fructose/sorbose family transporter subunit IID [Longimicrobiales bacterium]|nr:PTS system mannose/fructose/sorbose family transporter subunit IID [Longimicrobiales bacterium]
MAVLSRRVLASAFARSFLIQGSWNYRTMLGTGFAFAMLPALRLIFKENPVALEASVRRHLEHFNAHPYLSNIALGAALRLEADGESEDAVRRFKVAVRGPLGGLGDALVWASWLPAVSLSALSLVWLGVPGWVAVLVFLAVYNLGHVWLRAWGFKAGLAEGMGVARSLGRVALARLTERVRALAALLLGVLLGTVLGGEGGLGEAGVIWGGLAAAAFVAGVLVGHRLWRPTAVTVVATVAVLATFGWFL